MNHHNNTYVSKVYKVSGDIWVYMVSHKSIVKIKDHKQRRIVIPKELWDLEKLGRDDYIEINIKKVAKP